MGPRMGPCIAPNCQHSSSVNSASVAFHQWVIFELHIHFGTICLLLLYPVSIPFQMLIMNQCQLPRLSNVRLRLFHGPYSFDGYLCSFDNCSSISQDTSLRLTGLRLAIDRCHRKEGWLPSRWSVACSAPFLPGDKCQVQHVTAILPKVLFLGLD